jgi:hypothetical protein
MDKDINNPKSEKPLPGDYKLVYMNNKSSFIDEYDYFNPFIIEINKKALAIRD